MSLRIATVLIASVTAAAAAPKDESQMAEEATLRAAIAPGGDEVRLITRIGGKAPSATLQVGAGKPQKLASLDSIGAVEVAHGKVVVALAVYDEKEPFRIHVGDASHKIARPGKRFDMPLALGIAATPTGFTVFFQEVEVQNTNEAHTYMQKLDKDGAPDGKLAEVQVPWWIGDAAWNGKGYHLALYFAGSTEGTRLSMVSLSAAGVPEQHPDWASAPGQLSDMNLVASGKKIFAYYRGSVGDRLHVTDVTTIGQWGGTTQAAKDLGALAATAAIGINGNGQPVRVTRAAAASKKQ